MSSSKPTLETFFAAAETRLSCYTLTPTSPISDSRIHEIVRHAVKHAPSSFNVQSARALILLKSEHQALWDLAASTIPTATEEKNHAFLAKMASGFKHAYGTVLFFEDQEALDALAAKNPLFGDLVPEWADSSSGMHQFLVWTGLELEGLGCNLQHFNFMRAFGDGVRERWGVEGSWVLKSQLVFGTPEDGLKRRKERTYESLETRVRIVGAEE